MSEFDKNNDLNENLDPKKKQKPGLNAVRPDDYTEQKFKDMAKDQNLSQTEMFNRIFWNYIKDQKNEHRQLALNLEAEVNLISKDLNSILNHFKTISEKAQDTIISIKTNAKQTEKNLMLDIDTLQKRADELTKRNNELEQTNAAFNQIKDGLDAEIIELKESNSRTDAELKAALDGIKSKDESINEWEKACKNSEKEITKLQREVDRLSVELANISERNKALEISLKEGTDSNKEKDRIIKDMEKQLSTLEKTNTLLEQEISRRQDELKNKESKITSLETSNDILNNTLSKINTLKESEIAAIEARQQLSISNLESKINNFEDRKAEEIEQLQTKLRTEYEADKKMAVAELLMELAEVKGKHNELLLENANLKR